MVANHKLNRNLAIYSCLLSCLSVSNALSLSLSLATSSRSRPSRATRSTPVSWSTSRTWGPGSAGCWWTGWSWCRSSFNCCRRRYSSPWTPSTDTSRLHHSHPQILAISLKLGVTSFRLHHDPFSNFLVYTTNLRMSHHTP